MDRRRLRVGNLSFSTSQQALEAAFAAVEPVLEMSMPTDRETGQPLGFALVTMRSDKAASAAMMQLNGLMLDGRQISVREIGERPPRGGGGGGGFGAGGGPRSGGPPDGGPGDEAPDEPVV